MAKSHSPLRRSTNKIKPATLRIKMCIKSTRKTRKSIIIITVRRLNQMHLSVKMKIKLRRKRKRRKKKRGSLRKNYKAMVST